MDRRVRRVLYDAGILSSLNIATDEWIHRWSDGQAEFGFMIGVKTSVESDMPTPPCDAMLTVACEAQGLRVDQEGRLLALLISVREALVATRDFGFVFVAGDRLYERDQEESARFRRSHLGFNVTDPELLREEQEWALR